MKTRLLRKIRKRYSYRIIPNAFATRMLGVTVYEITDKKAKSNESKTVYWGYQSFIFSAIVDLVGLRLASRYSHRYLHNCSV